MRFATEAAPFETLKLRMVNGAHSALAYLSVMAGWATVDQAVAQPALRRYLADLMRTEIAPTLPALSGLDLAAYQERLLQRYANPVSYTHLDVYKRQPWRRTWAEPASAAPGPPGTPAPPRLVRRGALFYSDGLPNG